MNTDINYKFVNYNQTAFDQLLTFVDFAPERLTIAFVEVNFSSDRDVIIQALKKHPRCAMAQFVSLDFADPSLKFLQNELLSKLDKVQREPQKKLVLLITGLEKSIKLSGDYPYILQDLNFMRDSFTDKTPYPLVFFLPDYAVTRFAKFAPDFWAWRSGIFAFNTLPEGQQINKKYYIDSQVLQQKSHELRRLLEKYNRIPKPTTFTTKDTQEKVAELYKTLGQDNADLIFHKILQSSTLLPPKVSILRWWGELKRELGESDYSLKLYQKALEIEEKIKDVRNEARTLYELSILYSDRQDFQRAEDLIADALKLQAKIGEADPQSQKLREFLNKRHQAISLEQTAQSQLHQENIKKAIELYEQCLEIYKDLKDLRSQSSTLMKLATLLIEYNLDLDTGEKYLNEASKIYSDEYHLRRQEEKSLRDKLNDNRKNDRGRNPFSWFPGRVK